MKNLLQEKASEHKEDDFHIVKAECVNCKKHMAVKIWFNPNWSSDRTWAWKYDRNGLICECGSVEFKVH